MNSDDFEQFLAHALTRFTSKMRRQISRFARSQPTGITNDRFISSPEIQRAILEQQRSKIVDQLRRAEYLIAAELADADLADADLDSDQAAQFRYCLLAELVAMIGGEAKLYSPPNSPQESASAVYGGEKTLWRSWTGKNYEIEYLDANYRRSSRTITLFRLYADNDVIYLDAYCHLRKEDRCFCLDRIEWIADEKGNEFEPETLVKRLRRKRKVTPIDTETE
ncbi:hypothetical protein FACS189487_06920 [Campylobacterota bacterium]|nr:hypothetical protein FACS189487_06920 [Campylobacterota bacterium]